MSVKSILIVCRGNICRSPMAEGFFARELSSLRLTIQSAGINALIDHPADPNAVSVMKKNGIDISKHRARQITEMLVRSSDLILVMTHSQLKELNQMPSAKGKTFLLGHWSKTEVKDPYQQLYDEFENTYQGIALALQEWKKRI